MTTKASNTTDLQRDRGIDILRCMAAFFVIVIHCDTELFLFNNTAGLIFNALSRMGVGCFFLISGYFLPLVIERGQTHNHLFKVFKLAVTSFTLYILFFIIYDWLFSENPMNSVRVMCSLTNVVKLIVLNLTAPPYHLWYLFALLYVIPVVALLYHYKNKKYLLAISALLIIGGISFAYMGYGLLQRNWLFYGVPFVGVGILLREEQSKLQKIGTIWLAFVFLICIAAMITEVCIFRLEYDYFIWTLPASAILLLLMRRLTEFFIQKKMDKPLNKIAIIGLRYSLYIYIPRSSQDDIRYMVPTHYCQQSNICVVISHNNIYRIIRNLLALAPHSISLPPILIIL